MAPRSALTAKEPAVKGRRGRPSVDRAMQIDKSIREAGLKLFLGVGFESASMDAIAAAAPVSKGTLYARYPNKEALFRQVLEDALKKLSDRAGRQDHWLPDDLGQRLRHHARTLIASTHFAEFERVRRLIDMAHRALPDIAGLWHEMATGRYVAFLAEDMARSAGISADTEVDWTFLANLFLHSIGGWQDAERKVREVSDDEVIAFADQVVDLIMTSLPRSPQAGQMELN